jgi:hypothetical protein
MNNLCAKICGLYAFYFWNDGMKAGKVKHLFLCTINVKPTISVSSLSCGENLFSQMPHRGFQDLD